MPLAPARSQGQRKTTPADFSMEQLRWSGDAVRDCSARSVRQYLYLHSGTADVELDWGSTVLKPGAIVEAPAGSLFKLRLRRTGVAVLMSASDTFLWSLIPVLEPPASHAWRNYHRPRLFDFFTGNKMKATRAKIISELITAQGRLGKAADMIIAGYAFVILFQPIFYPEPGVPNDIISEAPTAARNLALEFQGLVEVNFRRHVAVPIYCRELGIPYAALARATRQLLGMSPLKYVNSRLLLEAQRELLHTNRSVATISYELGFSSPNYFTRYFTRHVNCSPLEYRNTRGQLRETEGSDRRGVATDPAVPATGAKARAKTGDLPPRGT